MAFIHQLELELIKAIQQFHGPALDSVFRVISLMGEQQFFFLILPVLFWCVDFRFGARLSIVLLLSIYLNTGLKDLFHQPRPFNLDPDLKLVDAYGFGLPSNHAQAAVVIWGGTAAWFRKSWFWAIAGFLTGIIGFSRVYLGVHFPSDVMTGWAIGAVLLCLYLWLRRSIENRLELRGLISQIFLVFGLSLILLLLHPTRETIAVSATMLGIGTGAALNHRYRYFNAHGSLFQRVLRFVIGSVILFVLLRGLKAVPVSDKPSFNTTYYFARYLLAGLWVSLGGPWLFRFLKISQA